MFIIFGKNPCIFCDGAKALLTMKEHDFSYRDIGVSSHYKDFKKWFPDAKTVPQILKLRTPIENWDSHKYGQATLIGGYKELQEYLK